MAQMAALYEEHQCSIVAVQEVPGRRSISTALWRARRKRAGSPVSARWSKNPRQRRRPNLAVIGRYILTPDIFDIIRNTPPGKNGEVQLTDALQAQAREGRVLAYQFEGLRFDCGACRALSRPPSMFLSTTTASLNDRRFRLFKAYDVRGGSQTNLTRTSPVASVKPTPRSFSRARSWWAMTSA